MACVSVLGTLGSQVKLKKPNTSSRRSKKRNGERIPQRIANNGRGPCPACPALPGLARSQAGHPAKAWDILQLSPGWGVRGKPAGPTGAQVMAGTRAPPQTHTHTPCTHTLSLPQHPHPAFHSPPGNEGDLRHSPVGLKNKRKSYTSIFHSLKKCFKKYVQEVGLGALLWGGVGGGGVGSSPPACSPGF